MGTSGDEQRVSREGAYGGRTGRLVVVALVACGLLSSCAGTDDDTAPEDLARSSVQEVARGYYADIAQCLTDQGIPATYDPEEIRMEIRADASQDQDLEKAEAHCRAVHGPGPTVPPFADRELTSLFEQSVEAYQCLVREGHSPEEPPTLEVFMAGYRGAAGTRPYLPHSRPEAQYQGGEPTWPSDVCPLPTLEP